MLTLNVWQLDYSIVTEQCVIVVKFQLENAFTPNDNDTATESHYLPLFIHHIVVSENARLLLERYQHKKQKIKTNRRDCHI